MSLDYSIGQRIGDYEILGVLGAGGMGKVYKVRNTISDRVEAMKILLPDLAGQKELADRFLREIKVLASLNHPNIAALRTALTLDNQLVMIMEFVDGVTLSSRVSQGALPPSEAIKYIDQVLQALSYAHKQSIIHRDIKPANMMLTTDGTVKLMDFGIARSATDRSLTMTGTTLGSLNYMPPEQVKGEPADNRSDLYSLGISLYELVTGQLPFQADSNYAMMAAHLQEAPKPPIVIRPGLPQALNEIILMALAKDPNERFQSAEAFRGALRNVQTGGMTTLPAVSPRTFAPNTPVGGGAATALFQQTPAGQTPTMVDTPAGRPQAQTQAFEAPAPPAPPVADGMPPPAARSGSGSRGLYIALGACIVLVVLVAAGFYLPRHLSTLAGSAKKSKQAQSANASATGATSSASSDSTTPQQSGAAGTADASGSASGTSGTTSGSTTSATADSTGAQTPQTGTGSASVGSGSTSTGAGSSDSSSGSGTASGTTASASTSSGDSGAHSSKRVVKPHKGASSDSQTATADTTAQDAAKAAADAAAAEAQEAEQQYDDLDSRTTAASQSLDNLKRQQSAAGYGLRGDIVSAEQRLKTDLNKAHFFMEKQDTKNAKKYLDMADAELQTIEKFLGH